MTKAPSSLQDLRRSLYVKAKAEPTWRFWGLYVHVCKRETIQEAYKMARSNNGAPGIDGVKFESIEESGVESFLNQIRDELVNNTYRPMRARKKEIPKDGGKKVRALSIPAIRDWLVKAVGRRLREELVKLRVEINEDKSRMVDLAKDGSFSFLGFEYRRIRSHKRVCGDLTMHRS